MESEIPTRFTKLVNVRFVDNKPFGFILSPAVFHVWKDHIVQRFGQTQTKRVCVHVIEPQSTCIQVIDHEINILKSYSLKTSFFNEAVLLKLPHYRIRQTIAQSMRLDE